MRCCSDKDYPQLAGSFVDKWHSEHHKLPSRLCRRALCALRYSPWYRGLVLCEAPNPSPLPPSWTTVRFLVAATECTMGKCPSNTDHRLLIGILPDCPLHFEGIHVP